MSKHLSEDQFAKCLVGQSTSAELQHIRECPECSAELEGFAKTISVFRSAVRNRIDDRIALHPSAVTPLRWMRPVEPGIPKWRWALVAAAVVAAVVLPFFITQNKLREAGGQLSTKTNPDAIMKRVNLHLSRTVPAPMEPLLLVIPNDESITESGGVQ